MRNALSERMAVKKPFLRKQNRKKRLRHARLHKNWTENQCGWVLWSDESEGEISGAKRYHSVRVRSGQTLSHLRSTLF